MTEFVSEPQHTMNFMETSGIKYICDNADDEREAIAKLDKSLIEKGWLSPGMSTAPTKSWVSINLPHIKELLGNYVRVCKSYKYAIIMEINGIRVVNTFTQVDIFNYLENNKEAFNNNADIRKIIRIKFELVYDTHLV